MESVMNAEKRNSFFSKLSKHKYVNDLFQEWSKWPGLLKWWSIWIRLRLVLTLQGFNPFKNFLKYKLEAASIILFVDFIVKSESFVVNYLSIYRKPEIIISEMTNSCWLYLSNMNETIYFVHISTSLYAM